MPTPLAARSLPESQRTIGSLTRVGFKSNRKIAASMGSSSEFFGCEVTNNWFCWGGEREQYIRKKRVNCLRECNYALRASLSMMN